MDPKTLKAIFKKGIETIGLDLFKACWSGATCNPDLASVWSASSPAVGQSDVTALVLRDMLGGEIMETQVNGSPYYYNRLKDGTDIDLTASQFSAWVSRPAGRPMADPDDLFVGPEAKRLNTSGRYADLSDAVSHALAALDAYWIKNIDPSITFSLTPP